MPSTLQHFWQLASSSRQERLAGTRSLLHDLIDEQKAAKIQPVTKANSTNANSFKEALATGAPYELTGKEVNEAEQYVEAQNCSEVTYAIRRLIKGLASHRDSSRLGFSVALCELIEQLETIPARQLITLIQAYSTPSGKVKGQEERDLLFANLFGLYAVIRSGILINQQLSGEEDFQRVLENIWLLGRGKTWLRESAAWVIVEAVKMLSAAEVSWKGELLTWLAEKICNAKEVGPEAVAIYLTLQRLNPLQLSAMPKLPQLTSQNLLASANLVTLAKMLREGITSEEDASTASPTGAGYLKLHFVWDMLLEEYTATDTFSSRGRAPFAEMYKVLVDDALFASNASDRRKLWGFQMFGKAIQMLPADELPSIFTPNFMRTWMNQLADKERMLHKSALQCVVTMQAVVSKNTQAGRVIVPKLIRTESAPFDAVTGTKTVEAVLAAMESEEAVDEYVSFLIRSAVQPESGNAHVSRRWSLDQLASVIRNAYLPTSDACITRILSFYARHGFFQIQSGKVDETEAPSFSPDARNICRVRWFSCLGDLNDRTIIAKELPGRQKREQGVMKNGEAWVAKAFEIMIIQQESTSSDEALYPLPKGGIISRSADVTKDLYKLRQKTKNDEEKSEIKAFEVMLLSAMLYSVSEEEEVRVELIEPLIECAEHLILGKKSKDGEPSATELLIHSVVSLLEKTSAFLRSTATHAFSSYAAHIDKAGVEQLLHHLGFNDEQDEEGDEGDDEMDDDVEGTSGDDDVLSDSVSITSASSISVTKESNVDPVLVARLQEVLHAAGVADSDEEEDSSDAEDQGSDFDDDQMMLIDDKLADIFRQRLGLRKEQESAKKEAATLHIKVLELLDIFVRRQSSNPLCIDLVVPLFTMALEKDASLIQLKQRATTILKGSLCRGKEGLINCVPGDAVLGPMEVVHKMAATQLAPPVSSLCTAVNVYLARACKEEDLTDGKIKELYISTLDDFIERKSNNLRPEFLIEAMQKVPTLGFNLQQELLQAAFGPQESAKKSYRRLQALEMLRATLVSLSNTSQEKGGLVELFSKVSHGILQTVSTGKFRLKEILKVGLDLARLLNKMKLDAAAREKVWPGEEITKCITALGGENKLPNATSLQGLLRQIRSAATSEGAKGKKHQREDNSDAQQTEAKRAKVKGPG